ncbi:MAG: DegT/DnrJ/EryC1/StrS family aminotransferase, partial [Chloroflexi bacterium]|nr:DegT/DnrJ/EryC1/StrS family aminotransferase [Chloroflexota bacterium]
ITANSVTSTLHMGLNAFGVNPGDEVIIPGLSVAMCGFAVWHCGAIPVFADSNPNTFLIDPSDIEKKITKKTKAIIPVHMFGLMCEMDKIMDIAKKNSLYVLEDCAQCFFALDNKGRKSGTIGHIGSWSFENSKHLSTGDGGIVTTNDEELATKMRQFGGLGYKNNSAKSGKVRISRDKFQDPNWKRYSIMAYNYRMPELCAAVGLAQCEKIEEFVELRIKMAEDYLRVFEEHNDMFITSKIPHGYKNTYYTFPVKFNDKNKKMLIFNFTIKITQKKIY